jgi:plastocyanin
MSNETLFFVCGIALAVSAVLISVVGLKAKNFPGKAFPLVVLWFAILVGSATTFAVLHAKDEEKAKASELENAGKEFEQQGDQSATPFGTEGALNGDEEEAKEESEENAENFEPVGPEEPVEGGSKGGTQGGSKGASEGTSKKKSSSGTSSGSQAQAPGGTLQLAADPTEIAFDKTSLISKPGKVTIDFTNPATLEHDVAIEKDGKQIAVSEIIGQGKTSVSADLEPGTYTFLCTVPGHAEAGMEGTLTVK